MSLPDSETWSVLRWYFDLGKNILDTWNRTGRTQVRVKGAHTQRTLREKETNEISKKTRQRHPTERCRYRVPARNQRKISHYTTSNRTSNIERNLCKNRFSCKNASVDRLVYSVFIFCHLISLHCPTTISKVIASLRLYIVNAFNFLYKLNFARNTTAC